MAKTVTIELLEPVTGHSEPIQRVVLRPPTGMEFLTHGEPFISVITPEGGRSHMEVTSTVQAYVEACIVEPADKLALVAQVGLADTMRLKDAVLDFFGAARLAGTSGRPNSSSAPSAG